MGIMNASFGTSLDLPYFSTGFRVRIGRRELGIGRDVRVRYYRVNPVIDCRVGADAGRLDILLCRRWLIALSKARHA